MGLMGGMGRRGILRRRLAGIAMKTLPAGIGILLGVMSTGAAFALDEVAYGVAKEPWTEGLGNH